jgi:formylglycine-generating enzyme required for sulfatase activity
MFGVGLVAAGCIPPLIFEDVPSCPDGARCDGTGDVVTAEAGDVASEPGVDVAEAGIDAVEVGSDAAEAEGGGDVASEPEAAAMDAADVVADDGAACPSGQERCGAACVTLRNDAANCGACGRVCSAPGAASACVDGACVMTTCMAGLGDCDREASNGCETNLGASAMHCGRCGNVCSFARARATCAGGACAVDACEAGWGNCDSDVSNGCETDTQRSNTHCGRCGAACGAGQMCVGGGCVAAQRSCPDASEAGCGMEYVPGGTFAMNLGSEVQDRITVNPFAVDRFEVTVRRFRRYVEAGMPALAIGAAFYPNSSLVRATGGPRLPDTGMFCNWSASPAGREDHPINCINWSTALAFCAWEGGRLPTAAEWQRAGRGSDGRRYPWGNEEAGATPCFNRSALGTCPVADLGNASDVGAYGVRGMSGNVREWAADTWLSPSDVRCWGNVERTNPVCIVTGAGVFGETTYTTGGGNYSSPTVEGVAGTTGRAELEYATVGFRCVRNGR